MLTSRFQAFACILGLISSSHKFGGITPSSRDNIVFIKPVTPLAPSKWPVLDLPLLADSLNFLKARN